MVRIAAAMLMVASLCFTAINVGAQDKRHQGTKEEQEACTPDVFRLCQKFIPDERRITNCLKLNRKRLSPACRKVFSS
jgi:hypothetical protein